MEVFLGPVEVGQDPVDPLLPITLLPPAQDNDAGAGGLGDEQVLGLLRELLRQVRIHDGDQGPRRVHAAKGLLGQNVKKLIRVKDTGRLHDHTVIAGHGHGDQFGLKAPPVRQDPVAADDHLHLAVFPHQILEQDHIDIDGTVIVFQDPQLYLLVQHKLRVVLDKCSLAGSQETGDEIDLRHLNSSSFYTSSARSGPQLP